MPIFHCLPEAHDAMMADVQHLGYTGDAGFYRGFYHSETVFLDCTVMDDPTNTFHLLRTYWSPSTVFSPAWLTRPAPELLLRCAKHPKKKKKTKKPSSLHRKIMVLWRNTMNKFYASWPHLNWWQNMWPHLSLKTFKRTLFSYSILQPCSNYVPLYHVGRFSLVPKRSLLTIRFSANLSTRGLCTVPFSPSFHPDVHGLVDWAFRMVKHRPC